MLTTFRARTWALITVTVMALLGLTLASGFTAHASTLPAKAAPPAATLGIWAPAGTTSPQSPNVLNNYFQWGDTGGITSFLHSVPAGVTPYVELEPWDGSNDTSFCNTYNGIGSGAAAAVSAETALGNAIASYGHPVILTFAHEFNVSGQYPWATGGACHTTAAQWKTNWDAAVAGVNAHASNAYWMWAPNVDTGGTTIDPTPYWPGAAEVDMVGVDGYPGFLSNSGFSDTFNRTFGAAFSEVHALTNLPIFISETNLAELGANGFDTITKFIGDMKADGGSGVLEFEEGSLGKMTPAQWTELNTALGGTTPPPPAPLVLSGGHVVSTTNTGGTVAWSSVPSGAGVTYTCTLTGPGPENGRVNTISATQAVYSGLESGHTYTVKVQGNENGVPSGASGNISFVTKAS